SWLAGHSCNCFQLRRPTLRDCATGGRLTRRRDHTQGQPSLNEGYVVSTAEVVIAPVSGKADLAAFIDPAYRISDPAPHCGPPLRAEVVERLTPGKNPFHEHAKMQLFLARRGGGVVGRISAHYDELALAQPVRQGMGPGTGNWGLFEAEDEAVAHALIAR